MRNLDLHVVLEIDDSDPTTDAEIAREVHICLGADGFTVVDVEALPEGSRLA